MQDSSPFRWLEDRGPACQLIAVIDDATSRIHARFTEHDTTEENLRTFGGWVRLYGRPLAHYTDKASIFRTAGPQPLAEQLRGDPLRTQFGRALNELGIEWIAAHSPQAKGRIERLFETLQDRLVKEMRLAGIDSIQGANHFLEMRFLPEWEQRFTVAPRNARNAHRRLGQEQHLEEILSVRVGRKVAQDHTVSWDGNRWGVLREEVCAGLRGAAVDIERRLDGSHWLRYRGRYLHLRACPEPARRSASPSGLRPPGLAERTPKPKSQSKPKYHVPAEHPWRKPWKRTLLSGRKPDISICVDTRGIASGSRIVGPRSVTSRQQGAKKGHRNKCLFAETITKLLVTRRAQPRGWPTSTAYAISFVVELWLRKSAFHQFSCARN